MHTPTGAQTAKPAAVLVEEPGSEVPEGQTQVHLVTAHKLDADGWPKGQLFSSATSVVLMTIRCIMTKGAATFKVAKDWTKVDPGLMPYVQDWLHSAALVQTGVGRVACEHEEQGGGVAPAANLPGPSRGTGGCCAETVRWSRQNGTPKVDCTHWRQQ